MNGNVSFNNNGLNTYTPTSGVGVLVNSIDHTNLPDKIISLLQVANANRSAITDINQPSRTIAIAGVINGSSQVDLDQRIDTLKSYLNGKDKNLDINYAGSTRRYIATVNSASIKRTGALKYATFKIEFVCTEPFGLDVTATQLINETGHTTASFTATPTVGGTAPYQLPIFTITVNSLTGTGDYVQISNDANGQGILILGQGIAAGDIIVIDCDKRIVTLDDEEIDYNGTFLELEPGPSSITYSDGFTTRNVDIHAEYFKRYS